ncbi:MAG: beta-lactamase/transpeptidase-like protein [Linnemannia gamsii]|nr:MAG: beta-lactamase/transpeptidase-like protein [Linnemannia gamsii]
MATSNLDTPAINHKEFLDSLPIALEKARADGGIPGMSVAIRYKGELVFAQGFGKHNRNDPFTQETVSRVASVTKAFTATAVGELVAEGKVDWNTTPVSHYLPEFELKDPVLTSQLTFADMLSHRTPLPPVDIAWFRNELPPMVLINQLKHLDFPSKMSPYLNYNNAMYAVAGEAAANVAGLSFADLIKTKIFEPLGLKDAGLSMAKMAKRPNYAMPYNAASFEDAQKGIYEEGYVDEIPMADAPGRDIYINVVDLVKWGSVIMKDGELDGKQVLNKASIQETLKAHNIVEQGRRRRDFSPTLGYGLGWGLDTYKGHTIVYHDGTNPGYRSNVAFFPDDDLVIAVLTNIHVTEFPSNLPFYIADGFLGLYRTENWIHEYSVKETQEIYDGCKSRNKIPVRIVNKPYSRDLTDYAGDYTHPVFGKITISLQGDGSLRLMMRTLEGKLEHHHYESFKGVFHEFAMRGSLFFTFITGSKGSVEAVESTHNHCTDYITGLPVIKVPIS